MRLNPIYFQTKPINIIKYKGWLNVNHFFLFFYADVNIIQNYCGTLIGQILRLEKKSDLSRLRHYRRQYTII